MRKDMTDRQRRVQELEDWIASVYQDGWTDEEVSALLRATVDEIREDQQG